MMPACLLLRVNTASVVLAGLNCMDFACLLLLFLRLHLTLPISEETVSASLLARLAT
jgi:hypothetical protein